MTVLRMLTGQPERRRSQRGRRRHDAPPDYPFALALATALVLAFGAGVVVGGWL